MKTENQMWAIHGGRTGDADSLFLQKQCVALGWPKVGDLSKLKSDRESFKAAISAAYPDDKLGAIPVNAGQLFRFTHEVKIGDLVLYSSKMDRQVHIGRIEGPYQYKLFEDEKYPNQRKVKWLERAPRTHFSQGALSELGGSMSFFSIKSYPDEFRAALDGKDHLGPVASDPTVAAQVASETKIQTEDYILKTLARDMKGHSFEDFVAHLLQSMGYRTRPQQRTKGADGGVDIIAHRDELGLEPPIIKVQVKSGEGSVGDPEVSALYGKCDKNEYALVVTLGSFSKQAEAFARNKTNLRLISGVDLVELILAHYEKFDSRYKGLLPLKRVYVADPEEVD